MALSKQARNTILLCVIAYAGVLAFASIFPSKADNGEAQSETGDVSVTIPPITTPRVCAAAEVYTTATRDDWGQRATIANTALNRYRQLGHVPNCADTVAQILADGLDTHLWQASLDAADAAQSGSYAIPPACARADTALPLPANSEPPQLRAAAARAQCVIGDIAFVAAL